jgi:hypothetical protein
MFAFRYYWSQEFMDVNAILVYLTTCMCYFVSDLKGRTWGYLRTGCRGECLNRKNEVTGGWRKLHNEELHSLYSSPSIIRMIKSRKVRWAGHVARMGAKRNVFRILVGKPERKRPLEGLDLGGRIIIK